MTVMLEQVECVVTSPKSPALSSADLAIFEKLTAEGLLTLQAVTDRMPKTAGGKRMSTSSLFRWIVRGKLAVKLEAVRLYGGKFWTTMPAVGRFLAAVTIHEQQKQRTAAKDRERDTRRFDG